jgi:folate-binding protein YgfZ
MMMVNLSNEYALLSVSGPDATTFLQGQLTADIREITPTKPGFAAYCNPKGRIRALFRIFYDQHSYFLQLPMGVLPSALAALKNVARFSKVTLQDVSTQYDKIGFYLTETNLEILKIADLKDIFVLPLPASNSYKRLELLGLPDAIKLICDKISLSENSDIFDFDAWKSLDIQAGIPEVWPETIEQFLPHVLNLPALGAVSFNKGCYCGQEIVARMEYRADIKHKLFNLKPPNLNNKMLPGDKIFSGNNSDEVIGTVITASRTDVLGIKI